MELKNECALTVPEDKEVIDTPIAYFWFGEGGILYSVAKSKQRDLDMIRESMEILKTKIGHKKVCLISDTSKTSYYTIEMREELARSLSGLIKAIAIVPCTPSGKIIASILFMRRTGFPAKIFDDLKEAKKWIKQYC